MSTWNELESTCRDCQKCALANTRTKVVFGDGNPNAEILFVGEAPGEQEDLTGIPFVGRGGQLLTDLLGTIGLDRSQYYIANMVKCRPPQNRDPLRTERAACADYLTNQIALIQPKILVCLGRIAATALIDKDYKITQSHGQWIDRNGIHITAFFHPAAILRDPRRRPDALDDVKALREKIRAICQNTTL